MKRTTPLKRSGFNRTPPPRERAEVRPSSMPPSKCRMFDGKARMDVAVPILKDDPLEHEGYRRLVAAMPCINCGKVGASQAAHGPTLGKSIKADDRTCVPLCKDEPGATGCHTKADQYQLFDRWERAERFAIWGLHTRGAILESGQWPKTLPLWGEPAAPQAPTGESNAHLQP